MKQIVVTFMALLVPAFLFAQDIFDVAARGTPAQVQAALAAGSDANSRDARGETVLMRAASLTNSPRVIAVLLTAGARVQDTDRHGATALFLAAGTNAHPDVTAALIDAQVEHGKDGGLVGEDVTEHVFRDKDIKRRRRGDQAH